MITCIGNLLNDSPPHLQYLNSGTMLELIDIDEPFKASSNKQDEKINYSS